MKDWAVFPFNWILLPPIFPLLIFTCQQILQPQRRNFNPELLMLCQCIGVIIKLLNILMGALQDRLLLHCLHLHLLQHTPAINKTCKTSILSSLFMDCSSKLVPSRNGKGRGVRCYFVLAEKPLLETYIFPVSGSGSAWLKSMPPSISTWTISHWVIIKELRMTDHPN